MWHIGVSKPSLPPLLPRDGDGHQPGRYCLAASNAPGPPSCLRSPGHLLLLGRIRTLSNRSILQTYYVCAWYYLRCCEVAEEWEINVLCFDGTQLGWDNKIYASEDPGNLVFGPSMMFWIKVKFRIVLSYNFVKDSHSASFEYFLYSGQNCTVGQV